MRFIDAAQRKIHSLLRRKSYDDSILALELTDFCNCNCIMCSQSAVNIIHGNSKGFMSKELVKSIVDDLEKNNIQIAKLLPFGLGESLLHPDFIEIMRYIFERNVHKKIFKTIDLHTNAILFSDEIQDFFLQFPDQINTLSFSLDAVNSETYVKIRRNRCLDKAYKNIEQFIHKREKRSLPQLHFQFIVMNENKDEAQEFLDYWSSVMKRENREFQVNYDWHPPMIKDTIFFKRLNPFNNSELHECEQLHIETAKKLGLVEDSSLDRINTSDEYIEPETCNASVCEACQTEQHVQHQCDKPVEHIEAICSENADEHIAAENNEQPVKTNRRPCSGPWKYQSISWDGEVTVCCIDTGRELSIGNVHNTPLMELWDGEKINNYRLWHIRGEFHHMPKCTICRNLDSPMLSNEEVIEWLKEKGYENDIEDFLKRIG